MTDEAPEGPWRVWQRRLTPPLVACAFLSIGALILAVYGGLHWPPWKLSLVLLALAAGSSWVAGLGIAPRTRHATLLTALATSGLGAFLIWRISQAKQAQGDPASGVLLLAWAWLLVPALFLAAYAAALVGSAVRRAVFR